MKQVDFICNTNYINPYIPEYGTEGSSGFDLKADIPDMIKLKPLERYLVPTGIYINLQDDELECQIRPRSGNAIRLGLGILNSPGTVDSDYQGEIKVIAINMTNEMLEIYPEMKIAQGVICPVYTGRVVKLNEVLIFDHETERGDGGFGHTGF